MADLVTLLQEIVPGVLSGGASAGTAFLTVFRDIRNRLSALEKKVGSPDEDPAKTGLFYTIDVLGKQLRTFKSEVDSWRDDPPEWMGRLVQRAMRGSMMTETEDRMEVRLRSLRDKLDRLEEELDRRQQDLHDEIMKSSPELSAFVTREEYVADSQKRAEEMQKIQQNITSANSFLRGVLAALNYVDAPPQQPLQPPRPGIRPPPLPPRKK